MDTSASTTLVDIPLITTLVDTSPYHNSGWRISQSHHWLTYSQNHTTAWQIPQWRHWLTHRQAQHLWTSPNHNTGCHITQITTLVDASLIHNTGWHIRKITTLVDAFPNQNACWCIPQSQHWLTYSQNQNIDWHIPQSQHWLTHFPITTDNNNGNSGQLP